MTTGNLGADAKSPLVTEELRELIGHDWPPVVLEVDRPGIRMWARAVGIADAIFYDEDVARSRGFERLPAPPGFVGWPRARPGDPEPGPPIRGLHPALTRSVNGGTEFESVSPILAGDELLATTRIVDLKEREGTLGRMLIVSRETTYRRGHETVATMRQTVINY
ncbi:MAG TPA: MaoC family dehydratase N-terminal domain-containing protein [Actinomycetota bacterium]|nr:MaoC family dehydratase N-terminal domain-containing protein [Actinomycetota bacterium]